MYTATFKNRSCTRKAATAVKVSIMHEQAAVNADNSIAYDVNKAQRNADRLAARQKKKDLKTNQNS